MNGATLKAKVVLELRNAQLISENSYDRSSESNNWQTGTCPNEKIATFSRFVLPFAFQLQSAPEILDNANLFYTLNDKTDIFPSSSDENILRVKQLTLCMNAANGFPCVMPGHRRHGAKPEITSYVKGTSI